MLYLVRIVVAGRKWRYKKMLTTFRDRNKLKMCPETAESFGHVLFYFYVT